MTIYADSNFISRLYVNVPGSEESQRWIRRAGEMAAQPLPVTWLHRFEILNAFQLMVFRGIEPMQRRVTPEQAALAVITFREDFEQGQFLRREALVIEHLDPLYEAVCLRHSARHGFRAYDILHVASARLLGCDSFWSFDGKANKLARLEGLRVLRR